MLTKGFKDQERKKLDQILQAGFRLEFVPEIWQQEERQHLDQIFKQALDTSLNEIETISTQQMLAKFKELKLSFSNLEHLADLLVKTIPVEPDRKGELARKAVAIYEFAQKDSQTFSLGLQEKIDAAKKKIK